MAKPIDLKSALDYIAELSERAAGGDAIALGDLGDLTRGLAKLLHGAVYVADHPADAPYRETTLRRGRDRLDEMARTFA